MFSLSQKNKNGIALIKRCFSLLLNFKFGLFLSILIIGVNLFIISIFLDFEYQKYGTHIYDIETLQHLMHIDFWNHMGHFLLILSFIFTLCFITLLLRIKLVKYYVQTLKKEKNNLWLFHMPSLNLFKESLRLSFINTIDALKSVTEFLHIESKLESLQHIVFGSEKPEVSPFQDHTSFLVLPLLIEKKISTKDAFKESKDLIKEKIGDTASPNFSFSSFIGITLLAVITCLGGFLHFLVGLDVFPSLIICIIIIASLASFIENVTLMMKVALYHFFTKQPIEPFTEKELTNLFKK